jgi:hypothetical protein
MGKCAHVLSYRPRGPLGRLTFSKIWKTPYESMHTVRLVRVAYPQLFVLWF